MALGDGVGYAFKRYKGIDGVWDSIANTVSDDYAVTMDNTPIISTPFNNDTTTKKKRKTRGSTSAKKKKKTKKSTASEDEFGFGSDDEDPRMNLMNRLVGNQERSALEMQINDVRSQITEDQRLLVMLRDSLKSSRAELRDIERDLKRDGIDSNQFCEDKWWAEAKESYDETVEQIDEAKNRVNARKVELKGLESQLRQGYELLAAGANSTPQGRSKSTQGVSPSKTGYATFQTNKGDELGSHDGSDEGLNPNYQPVDLGMSLEQCMDGDNNDDE